MGKRAGSYGYGVSNCGYGYGVGAGYYGEVRCTTTTKPTEAAAPGAGGPPYESCCETALETWTATEPTAYEAWTAAGRPTEVT